MLHARKKYKKNNLNKAISSFELIHSIPRLNTIVRSPTVPIVRGEKKQSTTVPTHIPLSICSEWDKPKPLRQGRSHGSIQCPMAIEAQGNPFPRRNGYVGSPPTLSLSLSCARANRTVTSRSLPRQKEQKQSITARSPHASICTTSPPPPPPSLRSCDPMTLAYAGIQCERKQPPPLSFSRDPGILDNR